MNQPITSPENFDHLSASSIGMYHRCGKQFEFRYIQGLKRPPGIAMISGSATHKGAERDLENFIDNKEHFPKDDVVDIAANYFGENENDAPETADEKGKSLDDTVKRTEIWYDELRDSYDPVAVEEFIELELPPTTEGIALPKIIGYIDVVETQALVDIKTGGRHKSQANLDNSHQMTIYDLHSLITTGKSKELKFNSITTKGAKTFSSWRTPEQLEQALAFIHETWKAICAGVFLPANRDSNDGWVCSEKFCGYWNHCSFGKM